MTPTSVTDHRRKPRDRGQNKLSIALIKDSIWLQEDSFIQDQNTQFFHEPLTAQEDDTSAVKSIVEQSVEDVDFTTNSDNEEV